MSALYAMFSGTPVAKLAGMRILDRQQGFSLIELLAVVALIGICAAMVIPITQASVRASGFSGDARTLKNMVGLAKMRASSGFTRARVRVNTSTNTYVLQVFDKSTSAWVDEGGDVRTSAGVTFGFGSLGTPPLNTQTTIEQSPVCTAGVTAANPIANTACIIFNSRGLPVDSAGNLFSQHGLYLRGDTGVHAVTVTATPLIRSWWSPNHAANWTEQ